MYDKIKEMLGDHKLLYACKYGSHLYGTDTPESDTDIRGIFLPSAQSLYLNEAPEEFNFSTGDKHNKNTNEDIDIKLFSLQKFIKLCKKGDTNGLDLFFSPSHPQIIIYHNEIMNNIFCCPNKIINIKTANAYVGYAIGQAKKYGIKGSRLGVIKQLKEYFYFTQADDFKSRLTLSNFVDDLIDEFYDESYCFKKNILNKDGSDVTYLIVCGAAHQLNITTNEFYKRMVKEESKYGWRTSNASGSDGIDWKALSHALRVLYQCEQLYTTGTITFPISDRDYILQVKNGLMTYESVEKDIIEMLEKVEFFKSDCTLDYKHDKEFVVEQVSKIYKSYE